MTDKVHPKMMPVRKFIELVWEMREKQCDYFACKNMGNLVTAKEMEHKVDVELGKYMAIINPHKFTDSHTHTHTFKLEGFE